MRRHRKIEALQLDLFTANESRTRFQSAHAFDTNSFGWPAFVTVEIDGICEIAIIAKLYTAASAAGGSGFAKQKFEVNFITGPLRPGLPTPLGVPPPCVKVRIRDSTILADGLFVLGLDRYKVISIANVAGALGIFMLILCRIRSPASTAGYFVEKDKPRAFMANYVRVEYDRQTNCFTFVRDASFGQMMTAFKCLCRGLLVPITTSPEHPSLVSRRERTDFLKGSQATNLVTTAVANSVHVDSLYGHPWLTWDEDPVILFGSAHRQTSVFDGVDCVIQVDMLRTVQLLTVFASRSTDYATLEKRGFLLPIEIGICKRADETGCGLKTEGPLTSECDKSSFPALLFAKGAGVDELTPPTHDGCIDLLGIPPPSAAFAWNRAYDAAVGVFFYDDDPFLPEPRLLETDFLRHMGGNLSELTGEKNPTVPFWTLASRHPSTLFLGLSPHAQIDGREVLTALVTTHCGTSFATRLFEQIFAGDHKAAAAAGITARVVGSSRPLSDVSLRLIFEANAASAPSDWKSRFTAAGFTYAASVDSDVAHVQDNTVTNYMIMSLSSVHGEQSSVHGEQSPGYSLVALEVPASFYTARCIDSIWPSDENLLELEPGSEAAQQLPNDVRVLLEGMETQVVNRRPGRSAAVICWDTLAAPRRVNLEWEPCALKLVQQTFSHSIRRNKPGPAVIEAVHVESNERGQVGCGGGVELILRQYDGVSREWERMNRERCATVVLHMTLPQRAADCEYTAQISSVGRQPFAGWRSVTNDKPPASNRFSPLTVSRRAVC